MIIDWKEIALNIYDKIKWEVSMLEKKPTLWAILVWNNPSSIRYIKQKQKWAKYTWINFHLTELKEEFNKNGYDIDKISLCYKIFPINGENIKNNEYKYKYPYVDVFFIKNFGERYHYSLQIARNIWKCGYYTKKQYYWQYNFNLKTSFASEVRRIHVLRNSTIT